MGLSVTEISVAQLKQTLATKLPILNGTVLCKPSIGTTEEDMWKQNIDFTDIDYLICVVDVNGTGATIGTLKLYIDSVKKVDQDEGAGENYGDYAVFEIDCTSITGEQELKITGDNDNAAGYTYATVFLFARDA